MGPTFCPAARRGLKLCEAWGEGAEWVLESHVRKVAEWFPEGVLPHYQRERNHKVAYFSPRKTDDLSLSLS